MEASPADPNRRKFAADFLKATLVFGLCLLWIFRTPLLTGQVESLQARPSPPEALFNFSEMVYEVQAAIWVQARLIKQGIFPGWTPHSQGGTPLIGKMQNAVFAPNHLPFYIFPASWMPFLFMLVLALKYYLAFLFAYLYARSLNLDLFGGIFSGVLFVFSEIAYGQIFSWGGSGLYLPLLLLLIELYFRGFRSSAQFLLPWAVALPFLSGHFESAFYVNVFAGVYFLAHLWNEKPQPKGVKAGHLARFIGLMLLGAVIAGPQIVPAVEYVAQSYNKAWHNPEWFGSFWEYETINKHISSEDAPLLIAGIAGLLGFAALLRSCLRNQNDPLASGELARKTAAALCLALTIACLANLGLDDSLRMLSFYGQIDDILNWLVGLLLLLFSFWSWRQKDQPYGLRILGFLLIASILIMVRTPPFSNILLHTPIFGNFHNTHHRWEYQLTLGVLCAAAFHRLELRGRAAPAERLRTTINVFGVVCVFLFGFIASQPLKKALARRIPTGLPPISQGQDPRDGGIMGPERQATYNRRHSVVGWTTASPPVSSIVVGVAEGDRILSGADATSSISVSGNRLYFDASVDLPSKPGRVSILARIIRSNGTEKILRGPELDIGIRGAGPMSYWWLIVGLLAAPLVFLCGPPLLKIVPLLILIFSMRQYQTRAIPADQMPYRLPGIERIKQDEGVFRISSLQYNFLQADYTNVYGLSDLRTGGDNLDVLTMIYFSHLYNHFLSSRDPLTLETGLRLLGLANVKYMVDLPGAALSHPALEPFYQGADLSVFKNKRVMPRAVFYSRYAYVPMGDWRDWKARDKFLGPIAALLGQKALDMDNTLLLNDSPSPGFEPSTGGEPVNSSVRIDEYSPNQVRLSVDTDRPGFVFLSDNYFPGWEARLNGKKTKILRSWITFRAVEVPAGKSSVTFSYRPLFLWAAVFSSAGIALGWILLYRRYRPRSPYSSDAAASGPVANPKKKKGSPPQDEGLETLGACGATAGWIVLSLIGSALLFWTLWSAFIYQGGIQSSWKGGEGLSVNMTACALLAGMSLMGLTDFFGTIRSLKSDPKEPT